MKEVNEKNSNKKLENEKRNSNKNVYIPGKNNYIIDPKTVLGKGSFGKIYLGTIKTTGEEVAMKLESAKTDQPQLLYEKKIYDLLKGNVGFPKVYDFFRETKYNALIMERLGKSIETLFNENHKKFSLLTCIMIIDQIISRIEVLHSKNLIHRDIKPDNFLIGIGNKKNVIYAIDFGLSKKYRDSRTGLHIPYRDGKDLTGTARYASINTHLGVEQSRRDDIESIGYMMIYLMKGSLPWQGMVNSNPKKKYDTIKKIKIEKKLTDLCEGLPKECIQFIQYARDMRFEDKPDYKFLKKLLHKMAKRNGLIMSSSKFDWILSEDDKIDNK
jgi:casein kinase 1